MQYVAPVIQTALGLFNALKPGGKTVKVITALLMLVLGGLSVVSVRNAGVAEAKRAADAVTAQRAAERANDATQAKLDEALAGLAELKEFLRTQLAGTQSNTPQYTKIEAKIASVSALQERLKKR